MEALELIRLVALGEDSRTQFKQAESLTNPKSLTAEMVAFSNTKGGKILLGVTDDGDFKGLSHQELRRLNQLISNAATDIKPSINVETENVIVDDKLILVVTIREGISKPYSDTDGVFWVKNGADKCKVTAREEIQRMFQSGGLIHADETPVKGTNIQDIDVSHFQAFFKERFNQSLDETDKPLRQLLENLGLAKDSELTLAGLLLFGKDPQRFRPELVVKAVCFAGNDPAGNQYRDSQDIRGNLSEMFRETMSFLTRNLRYLQGEQNFNSEGKLEVSLLALEELVVNMLIHRDYFISAPWRVFIFDDRIELISPGTLPNDLTIENIESGVSNIRNPYITSFAIQELPYRGIGTGIRRARTEVRDLILKNDCDNNLFTVTIPRPRQER